MAKVAKGNQKKFDAARPGDVVEILVPARSRKICPARVLRREGDQLVVLLRNNDVARVGAAEVR
jgi:hypothetical protein